MATEVLNLLPTEQRQWLSDRIGQAYDEWYSSFGFRVEMVEHADQIANSIASLSEIELIESANHGQDYANRCDTYVFGRVKQEPWYRSGDASRDSIDLWVDSLAYLEMRGYLPVEGEPLPGDVVVYFAGSQDNAQHFGIFEGNGIVVSKFAMGPLVRHPLELVPITFGDRYIYLRKTRDTSELAQ